MSLDIIAQSDDGSVFVRKNETGGLSLHRAHHSPIVIFENHRQGKCELSRDGSTLLVVQPMRVIMVVCTKTLQVLPIVCISTRRELSYDGKRMLMWTPPAYLVDTWTGRVLFEVPWDSNAELSEDGRSVFVRRGGNVVVYYEFEFAINATFALLGSPKFTRFAQRDGDGACLNRVFEFLSWVRVAR